MLFIGKEGKVVVAIGPILEYVGAFWFSYDGKILLTLSGWGPEVLNILQCTGHLLTIKNYQVQNIKMKKSRNPVLKLKTGFCTLCIRTLRKMHNHGGPIWILEATYTTSGCISLSHLLRNLCSQKIKKLCSTSRLCQSSLIIQKILSFCDKWGCCMDPYTNPNKRFKAQDFKFFTLYHALLCWKSTRFW